MARVLNVDDLAPAPGRTGRFEGHEHGASVSFFVSRVPAGGGPGLHTHPYEETFVITGGSATFTVDGEEIDAPEGTLVYVPDPASRRSAVAHVDGTTVLCFGGAPGEPFTVSAWEAKYDPAAAR
jgi:quercetin dioxygenase-like cupin family protein